MMSPRRTVAIARKEVLHIIRDPRNLFLVTISPAFLLFLLSYIFAFEISHLNLAALDLDRSPASRDYLADLTSDGDLILAYTVDSYEEISPLLLSGAIDAAIVIPPRFADTVHGGRPAQVQAIIDGADPFAGREAINSISTRSAAFVAKFNDTALPYGAQPVQISAQAWYNAGLQSLLSMVPGLLAIVLVMPTMALALALTREKETGTLEGLLATPISPLEYLAGKLGAYVATGLVSATLALLVAVLWFRVPYRGSVAIYFLLTADYFLACMGATVVIAHFVRSQQTSMFVVLLIFIVPSFFLAGLIDPISGDSLSAILTSYSLPSTHYVEISRVLFLKGLGLVYVARSALILLAMGVGALTLGLALFKKKTA